MRRKLIVAGVIVALLAAGGIFYLTTRTDEPGLATAEVSRYLSAWEQFDTAAMAAVVEGAPAGMAEAVTGMRDDLKVTRAAFRTVIVERIGEEQAATFGAELDVGGLGQLRYDGRLRLVRSTTAAKEWRIVWDHSSLHPDLRADRRFELGRSWATRAPIVGTGGAVLVSSTDAVIVGLAPGRIQDLAQVQTVLKQQLGTDPAAVAAAAQGGAARPEQFVPIGRVPRDTFGAIRTVLEPVPGIFFRQGAGRVAPNDEFALHLIGRVGEVTAERLGQLGPPYAEGDQVGLSGLEFAHERQLAGVPAGEVRIVDATGAAVAVPAQFPGTPPQPLVLTLDQRVQDAADQALAGVTEPAAIVAIDAPTGEVRAVAARPLNGFNRALDGRYPPGSSFKVVTAEALVGSGVRPDTTVQCAPSATIGGKPFKNFEDEAFGAIPFRTAFALSCNTAFVTQADGLGDDALTAAAARFGFGVPYDAGVGALGGDFPQPNDAADRAASAIGQGRVLASPLHMASVAAAVSSGTWRPPLILGPAPPDAAPVVLDPATVAILADLMREVVRTGTGTSAGVAGQDVAGKTGTAEFGNANPPETHAWFIGFRGPLAFAVVVEGGGVGGQVAAPIAARFLAAAPGG